MQSQPTPRDTAPTWADGLDSASISTMAAPVDPAGPRMLHSLVEALSSLTSNWQKYTGEK